MEKAPKDLWSVGRELADRVLQLLPSIERVDWEVRHAATWRRQGIRHVLQNIDVDPHLGLDDLRNIDRQKSLVVRNTRQFLQGYPTNNVLLWGARGTGKSSLVHALLNAFGDEGLRIVEVNRTELAHIGDLASALADLPYRFIVFCDDLSFEADDEGYKALKSALEGSLFRHASNVVIYATSNRRHLLPEYMEDNTASRYEQGELHESEAVEEKISLSDRFGLWLSFYPFKQDAYLDVVHHWTKTLAERHGYALDLAKECDEAFDKEAIAFALARGGRSGRTAQHFARDWVGARLLD